MDEQAHLLCGTGAALSLPLSPVLAGAAMADVADVMDRFNLLHAGDSRACRIHVVADKAGRIMVLDDEPKMTHDVRREWPAGRYRLRMTLVRTVDPRYVINLYPPPLGWRLYDQPVIAECSFERSPVAEHDG